MGRYTSASTAIVAQLAEHLVVVEDVAGSSPVGRPSSPTMTYESCLVPPQPRPTRTRDTDRPPPRSCRAASPAVPGPPTDRRLNSSMQAIGPEPERGDAAADQTLKASGGAVAVGPTSDHGFKRQDQHDFEQRPGEQYGESTHASRGLTPSNEDTDGQTPEQPRHQRHASGINPPTADRAADG